MHFKTTKKLVDFMSKLLGGIGLAFLLFFFSNSFLPNEFEFEFGK